MDCPTKEITQALEKVCAEILDAKECSITYNEDKELATVGYYRGDLTVNCAMNSAQSTIVDIIKKCCKVRRYHLG